MEISQKISKRSQIKLNFHQKIGKILSRKPFRTFIEKMYSITYSLKCDIEKVDHFNEFREVRYRELAREHGNTDKYGDLSAALRYATDIASPSFNSNSPSRNYYLYQEQIYSLRTLLKTGQVKKVFNFGVCFAYVDSILAKEFPNVEFIGIDLSEYSNSFNEIEFGHIDNLKFISGDVFHEFRQSNFSDSVLLHSRTLTLLPKRFIEKLYSAAHEAGFRYIYGFEPNGLSEETQKPYTFDLTEKSSVFWRNKLYLHNYTGIAAKCGFKIADADNISIHHPSPDHAILKFLAERNA